MKRNFEKIVDKFLSGQSGKIGNYYIEDDELVCKVVREHRINRFNAYTQEEVTKIKEGHLKGTCFITREDEYEIRYKAVNKDIIAKRLPSGEIVGNSSILRLVGRRFSFGKEVLNTRETDIQRYLSRVVTMVPFNVFSETGLNIDTIVFLDKGKEETVKRKQQKYDSSKGKSVTYIQSIHFTGAKLFKIDNRVYLFDIDRNEIEHKIFNPFLVEIPNNKVKSIKEAYKALMPNQVKRSINAGIQVLRQGEWFFIPTNVTKKQLANNKVFGSESNTKLSVYQRETLKLQAGSRNRPNHAQTGFIDKGIAYVTGKIEHSGREHNDLILKGWYKAIPNTAFDKSFTITGDVD